MHIFSRHAVFHTTAWQNKKTGKPYNAANVRHVNFPQIWGKCKGCPYGVGHWWCQTGRGVSEFLQVLYTKPVDIYYDFAAVLIGFNF